MTDGLYVVVVEQPPVVPVIVTTGPGDAIVIQTGLGGGGGTAKATWPLVHPTLVNTRIEARADGFYFVVNDQDVLALTAAGMKTF